MFSSHSVGTSNSLLPTHGKSWIMLAVVTVQTQFVKHIVPHQLSIDALTGTAKHWQVKMHTTDLGILPNGRAHPATAHLMYLPSCSRRLGCLRFLSFRVWLILYIVYQQDFPTSCAWGNSCAVVKKNSLKLMIIFYGSAPPCFFDFCNHEGWAVPKPVKLYL